MGIKSFLKKHRITNLFVILVLFSIVSLGISTRTITFKPAEWGFKFLSLIQTGAAGVGNFFSETVNSISELRRLKEEHTQLLERMKDYENLQSDIIKIQEENQRLKKELDLPRDKRFSYIPAEVIAKDPVNIFEAIVINKGSVQGIRPDQTVVAFHDGLEGLVGRITETGPFSAKLMPIYDQDSFIAARLTRSRYEGLIRGMGIHDDLLGLDYVRKGARREIQFGDLVVTSGMNSLFPKDIYIGRLVGINSREWESSLAIEVEPIVNFAKLEYVYVLKPQEEPVPELNQELEPEEGEAAN